VTRIFRHPSGKPPLDDLARFAPLLAGEGDWATRLANLLYSAIERWSRNECSGDDASLLDEALQAGLLPNGRQANVELAKPRG